MENIIENKIILTREQVLSMKLPQLKPLLTKKMKGEIAKKVGIDPKHLRKAFSNSEKVAAEVSKATKYYIWLNTVEAVCAMLPEKKNDTPLDVPSMEDVKLE